LDLAATVAERLQRHGLRGRTVTLKVRRGDFSTCTRQATLPLPVQDGDEIGGVAERLLTAEVSGNERIRLIGISVSGFAESAQLPLFRLD